METQATVDAVIAIIATAEAGDIATAEATANAPTPDQSPIRLTTSLDTVYYAVDGATTAAIFDSMDANGPGIGSEPRGQFAAGLTQAEKSFDYVLSRRLFSCEIESVDVGLNVVMTLPRHSNLGGLSPDLLGRWQTFERLVTEHEKRHANIHLRSMEQFKHALVSEPPQQYSDCDRLELILTMRRGAENLSDRLAQEAFHASEAERLERVEAPIQLQIDRAEAELAGLQEELDRKSAVITELRSKTDTPEQIAELNRTIQSHNLTVDNANRLTDDIANLYQDLAWVLP